MRLVFDAEATGAQRNKAHPFDFRNKLCNIGFRDLDTGHVEIFKIEYDEEPYGDNLQEIQLLLEQCTLLIGFNAKYDLHWLRRYNIALPSTCRVFDVQLAWYILTHQKYSYPSLDQVAEYYERERKLDVVKLEYWDRGIDTDKVPYDILSQYLEQDLVVTHTAYLDVMNDLVNQSQEMKKLVSVSMQDLVVLEDVEWNGLLYNVEKSNKRGDEIQLKIEEIDRQLKKIFGAPWFNPNSGDHLSALLYGGEVKIDGVETYLFTYKDGREKPKTRKIKIPIVCKGIFKPLEGTALAKEGFYSTDVATLKTLSENASGIGQEVIELLLYRSKIEKQRSTYFHGFPNKVVEYNWSDHVLHSNFNQCVAVSGRLSSAKPNVQNLEKEVKECIESRFKINE